MFFFVLLMALMVYWGFFKYRRRPGVPAPRSPSHNTPLELIWTIVPSSAFW
jgi:cytochrome c oxidase subunit 2